MSILRIVPILCLLFHSLDLRGSDILFFNLDCNVDAAGADNTCGDERFNILNILTAKGHSMTLLPDFHQANMAMLLSSNDFILIPDLEDNVTCRVPNNTFINPSEKLVLKTYVENGGRLLITGSSNNIEFLNDVFGLSLSITQLVSSGTSAKNETEAAGTPFQSCDSSIPNVSATFLVTSSMPSSKKCIYTYNGDASIAFFSVGQGSVTYLGYDFNDSGPGCSQNVSAWVECAFSAGVEVATYGISGKPAEVPTLSEWGIFVLSLILGIIGLVALKPNTEIFNSV